MKRWKNVNAAELRELRQTPLSTKILQLATLMSSVKAMGWDRALSREEGEARIRWQRLKKVYHAR